MKRLAIMSCCLFALLTAPGLWADEAAPAPTEGAPTPAPPPTEGAPAPAPEGGSEPDCN